MKLKLFVMAIFISFILFYCCNSPTDIPKNNDKNKHLYVLEKDHIFGGFTDVDVYHHTLIINNTNDSITIDVEAPLPEDIKRESIRSPAFGKYAYIPTEFEKYFTIPNMANDYLTDKPTVTTDTSYFWNDIKLGDYDGVHVPYSNYYGEGEEIFIKDFGVNNFIGLEVKSDYSIESDTENDSLINIEINQTMLNTTEEDMYMVGIVLHIPRVLNTQTNDTVLYNIIDEKITSSIIQYEYLEYFRRDGFGIGANGKTFTTVANKLKAKQEYYFNIKIKIKPLLKKFEIYPMYQIYFETSGERIWKQDRILIDGEQYNGDVDYLKVCGLAIPTYILFSINNEDLKVVSPDKIEPTFTAN